jgi:hypothetical protein
VPRCGRKGPSQAGANQRDVVPDASSEDPSFGEHTPVSMTQEIAQSCVQHALQTLGVSTPALPGLMGAAEKADMGIRDREGLHWLAPLAAGRTEVSVLEAAYESKEEFVKAMRLDGCSHGTIALQLTGMWEAFGPQQTYDFGLANADILENADSAKASAVYHSTYLPARLSVDCAVAAFNIFSCSDPEAIFRVGVVGCGFCVEEKAFIERVGAQAKVVVNNFDILRHNADVRLSNPSMPYLTWDEARLHFIMASISVSRNPISTIPMTILRLLEAVINGGKCCVSDDDAARDYFQKLLQYLRCLQDRGIVTAVSEVEFPSSKGRQVTFETPAAKPQDYDLILAEAAEAFATKLSQETERGEIHIGQGKKLKVYSEEGKKATAHYPAVYGLINLLMWGMCYAGSCGRADTRPGQSVLERSAQHNLNPCAWALMIMWRLCYLHPVSQSWDWSLKQVRYVYEWSETRFIVKFRKLWRINVSEAGFHLGRAKSILLDGLFCRTWDPSTYPDKFAWLERQSYPQWYKDHLKGLLLKAQYYSGGRGKSFEAQEAALQEGPLADLPPAKRFQMLVNAAKIAPTTKHEVQSRTASARSEAEIAVASAMSATMAAKCTKVVCASEAAAQAALWALVDLEPRIGITKIPKGDDFLTARTPKHPPAVSTWWGRTKAGNERAKRLAHYLALGNPEFRRLAKALEKSVAVWRSEQDALDNAKPGRAEAKAKSKQRNKCEHNKEKRNCAVRIVSTANFQTDNTPESCSNIRNAPFFLGVRRGQRLPTRKSKRTMHLHRLQK